jgi:hypothetical protein
MPAPGGGDAGDAEHGHADGGQRALCLTSGGAGGEHVVAHDGGDRFAGAGEAPQRDGACGHRAGEVALPAGSVQPGLVGDGLRLPQQAGRAHVVPRGAAGRPPRGG